MRYRRLRQHAAYGPMRPVRSMRMGPSFGGRRGGKLRIIIALVVVAISLFSYFSSSVVNPVTGKKQYISLTPRQEIALGLQAMPKMVEQHGGLHPDTREQGRLDSVCQSLLEHSDLGQLPWKFEFHLLSDPRTVNAFALPGGQTFITQALYRRLETEGQLAGVMGHEIGHVLARHSAQRMAKSQLTQGLTGAVVVAAGDARSAQVAAVVGQLVNMKYGRNDELESDDIGVRLMSSAGYDPRSMVGVMKILAEAGGGGRQPEFFSTHPNPENRVEKINAAIKRRFPDGVPEGLMP